MTSTLLAECDSVRASFHEWNEVQTELESQLIESLAALNAYQSHLDQWQQQLAHERDELRAIREQLEHDRAELAECRATSEESTAALESELAAAREKLASMSMSLLERTDELRTMEQQRAALTSELEQTQAKHTAIASAFDEQSREFEAERARWAEELRCMRDQRACRGEASELSELAVVGVSPSSSMAVRPAAKESAASTRNENPVMGSIMQQFSKLRQQRANDRESLRKAR